MTTVWLPTGQASPLQRQVKFVPVYTYSGEQPVHVAEYVEGSLKWYGSGSVVVDLAGLPIRVTIPVRAVGGRIRWGVPGDRRRALTVALKKISGQAGSAASSGPGAEDVASWPNLWEHLTATKYPDGTDRETSSLIIVADNGGWRGCLSDKDNGRTMWKTASSVEGLLLALEEGAAADDPSQWRAAGGGFKNRRKRS